MIKIIIEDIEERIKEYSHLIKKYPNIKQFNMERAKLYEVKGQYKKAVTDFKEAYSGYYVCEDIMGVCKSVGLKQEVERLYTKAINKDKNNIQNYINRIYFYMDNGEYEKALKDCTIVLKLSPKDETILTLHKILTKSR